MFKWNFINSYYLLSKYTVLFCMVITVKGICVLSLVLLHILFLVYQETTFLFSHCFYGLSYSCRSAVVKDKISIHTVKKNIAVLLSSSSWYSKLSF